MEADEFLTIGTAGESQTRVMASRFIGSAFPCSSIEIFEQRLEEERKRLYDATHWCYAYRFGRDSGLQEKSSDAGEPHGTAGLPMLREIQSRELTDCGVIVTRYFGGTKLGTGNLGRAYGECAALALDNSKWITRIIYDVLHVDSSYDDQGLVYHWSSQHQAMIEPREITDHAAFVIKIRTCEVAEFSRHVIDSSSGRIQIAEAGQWVS